MVPYNVNEPVIGRLTGFQIDYAALRAASVQFTDTGAGLPRLKEIISGASKALRIPKEFIEVVLHMECGYPEDKVYKSSMPRLGDASKRLPNPEYPHPGDWAASQARYRVGAQANANTQRYIGITQISWGFWKDIRETAGMQSARIILPAAWWEASLFWQIVAPFVYLDRYRSKFPVATVLTPAVVYALHQQGPGGAEDQFNVIIGKQSGKTPNVIKAAQHAMQGRRTAVYI